MADQAVASPQTIDTLIGKVKTYLPTVHERHLREAYEFAEKAHAGQTRIEKGMPYITHPLAVAFLLADLNADEESIMVGFLHDVVEDTKYTLEEISHQFGPTIARMVDSLTKFPKVHNITTNQEYASFDYRIESIRKIFEILEQDARVAVIKLCDRLHNMQTLDSFRPEKQKRIAQETFDIYVKMASRIGMGSIKEKLEESCYCYLFPDAHLSIQLQRAQQKNELESYKKQVRKKFAGWHSLSRTLDVHIAQFVRFGDAIERKNEHPKIETRMHIVLDTEEACYLAMREIHAQWKSLREHIRDYIHLPKSNGYQALKTSITKSNGALLRIILQTPKMYEYGQIGVASQCFLKGLENKKIQLPWMQQLKSIHKAKQKKSTDYLSALEHDILKDYIIIYLPANKTLFLPPHSTILDAAFHAYGKEAWKLNKGYLNGNESALSRALKQGDSIRCELGNETTADFHWLEWVDTTLAKSFIREFLQQSGKLKSTELGKKLLNAELVKDGKGFTDEFSAHGNGELLKHFSANNLSELYQKIGEGEVPASQASACLIQQSTDKKVEFILEIQGALHDLLRFIEINEISFQPQIRYYFSGNHRLANLMLKTGQIPEGEYRNLVKLIERSGQLTLIKEKNLHKSRLELIFLISLTLLWGLDPIIARELLHQSYTPVLLTVLRFASVSIFLFLFILLQNWYQREITLKKISIFNPLLIFISFLLFGVSIVSYGALQTALASDYLLVLRAYPLFILFAPLVIQKKKNSIPMFLLMMVMVTLGYGLLFFDPERVHWSLQSKFLLLLSMILFGSYYFFSSRFSDKIRVLFRYYQLQLILSCYALIFALTTLMILPVTQLTAKEYLYGVLYACLFTGIPHIIYFQLIRQATQSYLLGLKLSGPFFVAIIMEIIAFGIIPSLSKILSSIIIFLSLSCTWWYLEKPQKE